MSSQVAVQIPKEYELLVKLIAERTSLGLVRRWIRADVLKARLKYMGEFKKINAEIEKIRAEKNVYYNNEIKALLNEIAQKKKEMKEDANVIKASNRLKAVNVKIKAYGVDGETDESGKPTGLIPKALSTLGVDVKGLALSLASEFEKLTE
jgi:valyl-tRNA synthetase